MKEGEVSFEIQTIILFMLPRIVISGIMKSADGFTMKGHKMYLTPLDNRLLYRLKQAQTSLPDYVVIDDDFQNLYCAHGCYSSDVKSAMLSGGKMPIKMRPYEVDYALTHLIDLGLVDKPNSGPCYQVTYLGWYNTSIRRTEMFSSLLQNLLFPAIVAVASSIITTLILQLL